MTHFLFVVLLASLASIIIQACGDGHTHAACANAAQQFEANPTEGAALIVRQNCGMEEAR